MLTHPEQLRAWTIGYYRDAEQSRIARAIRDSSRRRTRRGGHRTIAALPPARTPSHESLGNLNQDTASPHTSPPPCASPK